LEANDYTSLGISTYMRECMECKNGGTNITLVNQSERAFAFSLTSTKLKQVSDFQMHCTWVKTGLINNMAFPVYTLNR